MVSENRVLRGIFGPKREEVAGGWRRLHNEELHKLNDSQNIIRVIESRRMRWAGYVARVEETSNPTFWSGILKEGDHSKDLDVDGNIILDWILGK
jgi:hypothetical protein